MAAPVATDDDTETPTLQAAIPRRNGKDTKKITKGQDEGYYTVWNRPYRMHEGGLERAKNKPRRGSKSKTTPQSQRPSENGWATPPDFTGTWPGGGSS